MNWTVFEIATNFYQGFLFIFFIRKVLAYRKHTLWIDLVFSAMIGVLLSIHQFMELSIPDTLIFLIPLLHAILFSEEKWHVSLFWSIVLGIITVGMAELFGTVLSSIWDFGWDALLGQTAARLIYVVGANIVITIITLIIARLRHKHSLVSMRVMVIFLATLLVELLVNEEIYYLQLTSPEGQDTYGLISAFSLIAVAMMILLFETMSATNEQQRRDELTRQTANLNQAYLEELKLTYQKMLADQHDLKHRLNLAEQLLTAQPAAGNDHAAAVLNGASLQSPYATGNMMVDAILTAKASTMQHAGIRFSYSGAPLQKLPLSESDFCVLLSNILDNAIEGVMRLPAASNSRAVKLTISRTWSMFSITCQNDMEPKSLIKQGEHWVSSKENRDAHGFGMQSIRHIVESADGFVLFEAEGSLFSVKILIPDGGA